MSVTFGVKPLPPPWGLINVGLGDQGFHPWLFSVAPAGLGGRSPASPTRVHVWLKPGGVSPWKKRPCRPAALQGRQNRQISESKKGV